MDRVRFLHIPKTAGSTFSRILRNQYKGKPTFRFRGDYSEDQKRFSLLSDEEKSAITLFTGHAPIVTGVKEADEVDIITILRDPVSRVKSFCQHVSEGKTKYLLDRFPPASFDLDEFLCSDNSELSNLQSRMLINYEKNGSELLIKSMTPEQIKIKALENLTEKVTQYGLQEYFEESLILFAGKLGWRTPYYEYINRKDARCLLNFEKRHIEKIVELNAIDLEVYQSAKKIFENIVESEGEYKYQTERFRRNQKLASPLMKIYGEAGRYIKRKYRVITGS